MILFQFKEPLFRFQISIPILDLILYTTDQFPSKWYPIPDQNLLISIPYPRLNFLKTIPFTAAYIHIANIWENPPPGEYPY